MSVTSIRLQPELEIPLDSLAAKLDRSKNYIINLAIREFLERQAIEDYRWSETLVALESVKAGRGIDDAEVAEWLNSWGSEDELEPPKT